MLYVDAHQDLAYGALAFGRDYRRSVHETRTRESNTTIADITGTCTLGFPEMRRAGIGLVFATVFTLPAEHQKKGELAYHSIDGAHAHALAQLDIYNRWVDTDEHLHLVRSRSELARLITLRNDPNRGRRDIGLVLLMENPEPILDPDETDEWWKRGVRIIGPAWARNRYTGSSREGESLQSLGEALLDRMQRCGFVLDLTHMSDNAASVCLERYSGPLVVTHANARRFVSGARMIADEVLQGVTAGGGILGLMPANWALGKPDSAGQRRGEVSADSVADTILRLRRYLGSGAVGLGSDWEGGFGREQLPGDFDSIGDIGAIAQALLKRGASDEFVESFMGGNWRRFIEQVLPE